MVAEGTGSYSSNHTQGDMQCVLLNIAEQGPMIVILFGVVRCKAFCVQRDTAWWWTSGTPSDVCLSLALSVGVAIPGSIKRLFINYHQIHLLIAT